jgi:hypothetical protein
VKRKLVIAFTLTDVFTFGEAEWVAPKTRQARAAGQALAPGSQPATNHSCIRHNRRGWQRNK